MLIIIQRTTMGSLQLEENKLKMAIDSFNSRHSIRIESEMFGREVRWFYKEREYLFKFMLAAPSKILGLQPDIYLTDNDGCRRYFSQTYGATEWRHSITELVNALASDLPLKAYFIHEEKPLSVKDNIKRVIFSGPATIVLWNDGTKTVVKLSGHNGELTEELRWSGLAMCISKKVFESYKDFKKSFKQYCRVDSDDDMNELTEALSNLLSSLRTGIF